MAIDDGVEFKKFGGREQRKAGVRFELGGEEFTTLPEAPAAALNDLMAGITLSDDGERVYSAPNLIRFMLAVLPQEQLVTVAEAEERGLDVEGLDHGRGEDEEKVWVPADDFRRFREVVTSKRYIVPIDDLGDAAMWVAEKLSRRPFTPSRQSPPGRR